MLKSGIAGCLILGTVLEGGMVAEDRKYHTEQSFPPVSRYVIDVVVSASTATPTPGLRAGDLIGNQEASPYFRLPKPANRLHFSSVEIG